jgi:Uma2 family endonuclease
MAITTLMTADLLFELDLDGHHDLIRGELVSMAPAGARHGRIAAFVAYVLLRHLETNPVGMAYGAETGFILVRNPDTVLAPDAAFVRADRLPPDDEQDGFLPLAPDLAVEVLSPSERAGHLNAKVSEYLTAGVRLLWVIDPARQTVTIYSPVRPAHTLTVADTLDGGDVLPGFSLPVSELFR